MSPRPPKNLAPAVPEAAAPVAREHTQRFDEATQELRAAAEAHARASDERDAAIDRETAAAGAVKDAAEAWARAMVYAYPREIATELAKALRRAVDSMPSHEDG